MATSEKRYVADLSRRNANLVESLGSALRDGEHGLSAVPNLLKRILREESWREFTTRRDEVVRPRSFAEFVVTPPLKGLGADIDLIRRVVSHDVEANDLLDRALQRPAHRPPDVEANDLLDRVLQRPAHRPEVTGNNVPTSRPGGNTRAKALRRLRKDRPDLHARVIAEELSPHAAMVEAGFRRKMASVPIEDIPGLARVLRRRLSDDDLDELRGLLSIDE